MKIGIFDSGLGGLLIAKSIVNKLPGYDYIYLGDTKNLPYGNKSQDEIYKYTVSALVYLFNSDCKLVIIACNTASAKALRKIQREFLPKHYPNRKVLGVIVPTLEAVDSYHKAKKIGVLSTISTAKSHVYKKQLKIINPKIRVLEQPAPKLVNLIEAGQIEQAKTSLRSYLKPLIAEHITGLVLGCTHYPILKKTAKIIAGKGIKVFSQDEIIADKLKNYLKRHREIGRALSKKRSIVYQVTKVNKGFKDVAKRLFGKAINLKLVTF